MIYSAKYETHDGLKKWCVLQIDLFRNALVYWDQISQTDIIQDTEQRFEKKPSDKLGQFPDTLKSVSI
jgi:hypothetical protein